MSLLKAEPGSNPADPTSMREAATGAAGLAMSPAVCGFVEVPFPKQMPARSNAEIAIQSKAIGAAQQGTSLPAFQEQTETPDAETGS